MGFFTLMTSTIRPIHNFGLFTGISVVLAFLLSFHAACRPCWCCCGKPAVASAPRAGPHLGRGAEPPVSAGAGGAALGIRCISAVGAAGGRGVCLHASASIRCPTRRPFQEPTRCGRISAFFEDPLRRGPAFRDGAKARPPAATVYDLAVLRETTKQIEQLSGKKALRLALSPLRPPRMVQIGA